MSETRYYQIPGHYGYGDEFPTLAAAVAEAAGRIERTRVENAERGTFVPERLCVDERVKDATGDRALRRYTIEAKDVAR